MTVPQMPAANAASSPTKRRTATVRCELKLVPGVPFPVESDFGLGPEVVTGQDPLAAATLAREVSRRPGPRADAHDQNEDSHRAAESAEEHLAWNVEDIRDAGADVVCGGLGHVRILLGDVLRLLDHGLRRRLRGRHGLR